MVPTVSGVKVMGGRVGESYNWGGRMSKVQFMFNLILPVPDTDVQISTSVKRSQSVCSVFDNNCLFENKATACMLAVVLVHFCPSFQLYANTHAYRTIPRAFFLGVHLICAHTCINFSSKLFLLSML